jgi:hypothetical protein
MRLYDEASFEANLVARRCDERQSRVQSYDSKRLM